MKHLLYTCVFVIVCLHTTIAQSVNDSLRLASDSVHLRTNPVFEKDSITIGGVKKPAQKFDPQKATIRSAIIPGWGQAYTKRYLMVPVVYAALGVPAGFYFYNNTWYKRSKLAYEVKVDRDTASFPKLHPNLRDLSQESLRFYRNEFRRNRDYSLLFFLLAWGLNVVDATVFAHLKEFDVSDDLSMKIKPNLQHRNQGVSLVLSPKNKKDQRLLTSR